MNLSMYGIELALTCLLMNRYASQFGESVKLKDFAVDYSGIRK